MVGGLDDIGIVLHHQYRISAVPQLLKEFIQTMDVTRVQTHAGLVEDIHHVDQAAAEVFDDLHALRFTPRERVRFAI